jgi:hypothetical protein
MVPVKASEVPTEMSAKSRSMQKYNLVISSASDKVLCFALFNQRVVKRVSQWSPKTGEQELSKGCHINATKIVLRRRLSGRKICQIGG